VRFIDKPDAGPAAILGVPVASPGAEPVRVSARLEESLAVGDYLVLRDGSVTKLERLSDGTRWQTPARGRNVLVSPDEKRIAWSVTDDDLPPDRQVAAIWVANLDGTGAQQVATVRRGGLSGWLSNDLLLVSGRESAGAREQVVWALPITGGERRELARAERLRSPTLSPSRSWLVFYTTFDPDPEKNGLWLAPTQGGAPVRAPGGLFGAYQWRGCSGACLPGSDRLVVVPFDPGAPFHEFWELDPTTGEVRKLTDAAVTPLKIANGDWRVSPDGRRVAWVDSSDRNIWTLDLPR
jgi:Tol biopolymer transport system component